MTIHGRRRRARARRAGRAGDERASSEGGTDVAQYRVGIIGTGRPRRETGATGFGMSHLHARGYLASGRCEIVALADVKRENAEAFRSDQGIPDARLFEDYREMLARARPDVVSVCTWPHLHAEMVVAAAEA